MNHSVPALAGQFPLRPNSTSADDNEPYGGDPILLTGNMHLCARADGDGSRYFSGSVAQASFFNEALNASTIMVGSKPLLSSV